MLSWVDLWERMHPTPGLEASTSTTNWQDEMGIVRIGAEINLFLRSAKALSASLFQQNRVLGKVSEVRGIGAVALDEAMIEIEKTQELL